MTQILKQSTAVDVLIGPFVDLTDGYTAETGESPTVKLSKNGQALAAKSDATTPTSDADGYYNCELDATDTGTLGTLVLTVAASANALPVRHEYMVVPANAYDALVGGTDTLNADITQISGDSQSATDLKDFADAGYDPVTNKVQGVVLVDTTTTNTDMVSAAPTAAAIADAVWDETLTAHVTADSAAVHLKDILADTAVIGAAGAGLTAVPWNASWDAEVQSEVTDALNAYDPPTKAEMDTGFAAVPTATENADALLNRDMSAVSDTTARSPLNALRFLRNKWSVSGTTLTVTKEDDSTSAWTATVTTDATADPVTGNDPA